VGLLAVDALLDRVGRSVDEVLGLLEAEAGDRADDLDHLDLLVAGAGEDDIERGLLLGSGAVAARGRSSARGGDRNRGSGRDPPLVLDLLLQLDQLEDGHLPQLIEQLVNSSGCHHASSSGLGCSVAAAVSSALGSSVAASAVAGSVLDVSSV